MRMVRDIALEAERASAEPLVLSHSLDEDLLGGGGGLVLAHEVGEEGFEFLGVLAVNELGGVGREAVGKVVEAGFGLALFGLGPGGFLRVQFIGCNLTGCCHKSYSLFE